MEETKEQESQNSQTLEICQVPNYRVKYEKTKKINQSIQLISKILLTDLQFHERLHKDDLLKLSIDVDKLKKHNPDATLEKVLNDVANFIGVGLEEISYTSNKSVIDGSHHIVIPSYFMISSNQKILWKNFKKIYGYGKEIDSGIFDKDGWFRLPNQTKEGEKETEHIILHGIIEDFVLKYIPCDCKEFKFETQGMPSQTHFEQVHGTVNVVVEKTVTEKKVIHCEVETEIIDENDKYIDLLFNVIKNERDKKGNNIISWDYWFQIAGTLKSNNYEKKVFIEYSNLFDTNSKASELWDGIRKKEMSIFTLRNIAKTFNFKGYQEWLAKYEVNLYQHLYTSGLIADYFVALYGEKFIFNDDKLYIFNGVYWELDDKKMSALTNFVDKTFYADLINYATSRLAIYNSQLSSNPDDETVKITINKITVLLKNIYALRKVGNRNEIISDIVKFVSNNHIEFDNNPYLFAFENAVFDLNQNKFIEPSPSQHITKTSGYSYNFDYDDSIEGALNEILDTIFPITAIKDYYLSCLSTGLCGLQQEYCFIATGTGGNGKSLINSLMMKTLGAYGYKLPSHILLAPIKSGANPEVANMHNKRFVLTQEPNTNKKVCCSTLKEVTGDKTLNVRDLYSSKCSISLVESFFVECNGLLAVDEVNDAVFRRIRIIPFSSRYVTQEVYDTLEDKTNIFVANSYYKTDEFQNEYKQALFTILIKKFVNFKNNNYSLPNQPKECIDKNSAYLATCDDIYSWFETCYEKTATKEESDAIPFADIYSQFTSSTFWETLSKVDKRKYNKKFFITKIEENIFLRKNIKMRDSRHKNVKLKSDCIVGWKLITSGISFPNPEEE